MAWIATVPGFSPDMVATQLPEAADPNTNAPAEWVARGKGFITVSVVGGNPDPLLPVHRPVLQVDCWAVKPASDRPPWGVANVLAENVVFATWDRIGISRLLRISAGGIEYPSASVQGASVVTAPRRLTDDVGKFARYSLDLRLQWIAVADHLD